MFRVGMGQDSHRFSTDPNKPLLLGSVLVPDEPGLEGNSDADVVLHALCSALEQAIGGDSFSMYADKLHAEGINDSTEYLKISYQHVQEAGYKINNIGLSLECKKPRIVPLAEQIKSRLADLLSLSPNDIGINATSGEGMTPFGKGEGIQAFAIVSLIKQP